MLTVVQPNLQQIFYMYLGVYVHILLTIGLFSKKITIKNPGSKFVDPSSCRQSSIKTSVVFAFTVLEVIACRLQVDSHFVALVHVRHVCRVQMTACVSVLSANISCSVSCITCSVKMSSCHHMV